MGTRPCPTRAAAASFILGRARRLLGQVFLNEAGTEQEDGDIDVAVLGPDELVRAALKWQVLLTDTVHTYRMSAVGP
jgi:hypothetical protein